ncbi:MAG: cyclic nucleotide-binding domain-containing protein [Proteobacteria bacterium]|nr:cyclic nucleotide-binding domain-containing protein [Pseudomonadota bacterium]
MDKVEFLSNVELFKNLIEEELAQIERLCRTDEKNPGEKIFQEGEQAGDICIVIDGQVDLRFELPGRDATVEHNISSILPGRVFGWSALVPPHIMMLSSYAGSRPCRFYRIEGKVLIRLFEEEPRIGYLCMRNLTGVIAKRFQRLEDELARQEGMNLMHKW